MESSNDLTEGQRQGVDSTGLTVIKQGMKVGVPVGTDQSKRDFAKESVNRESAELVRASVSIDDAQASFHVLRLSATSRLSHLFVQSHPLSPRNHPDT